MTAGELARETGLTTASITGVLDRLEDGGFVRRERDPKDRRRVIVTLNPGPGLREIGPTFGPLVRAWRDAAAGYSDEELRLLLDFQRRFEGIVRDPLARLRGGLYPGGPGEAARGGGPVLTAGIPPPHHPAPRRGPPRRPALPARRACPAHPAPAR